MADVAPDLTLSGPDPSNPLLTISVPLFVPQYDPLPWARRSELLVGSGGSVTVQDMGVTVKDLTMKLSCNEPALTTDDVLQLYALWFQQGIVCTLTDWADNAFDVFFRVFRPKPFVGNRWSYDIELVVLAVTRLLGQTAILPA